jgi:cysteine-rich repeat protein
MQCDALGFASSLAADCSKPGPTGGTQICLDGKCVEAKCQAGQKLCADPVTLATCKADGTGWLKTGCPGGEGCEDGACKPIVCTPGASSCSGSAVVQCSAAGTSQSTVVDCATSGQLCKDGTCQKPDCQSGTTQCQGEQLATCKADGSGWTVAACPAEQACIGGACKAKVCTPAALGCQGTAVAKCDATGTGWTTLEDCAGSGKSCLDGACVSQVCQGGTVACVGLNVGTCKSDGSGWVEQACGDGKVCDGGGCVAQACPPGAASCQGAKAYKCDAKGLLQVFVADCASEAKVCSGGVCVAPYCGDGAVDVAGEECDDGNSKDGDGCSSGCKLEGPVFKGYAVWKMTTTKQDDAEMDALMDQACKKYGTAARAATAGEIIARKIVGMPEKNLPESGPGAYLVATRCPDCQGYELSWAKSGFKRRAAAHCVAVK